MLTINLARTHSSPTRPVRDLPPSRALSRLLSAAVVNREFRELLLADPARALSQGYQGEAFQLDYRERKLVLSIRAVSLADFAQQLNSAREHPAPVGTGKWVPAKEPALFLEAD